MRRDDLADLGTDSIGGDRSIGTAQVHPAPDQGEGPDEYAEGQLDDSIQRLLLLLQLGSGKGRWRRILLVHGRPAINEEGVGCRAYPLPGAFLGEHLGTFRQTRDGHDPVARTLEFEDPNPLGVTADLTEFIHLASKHLAVSGHQHDLIAVSDLKKP